MQKIIWRTEKRAVNKLKPCEWNPRQATEKETQDLTNSIEKFSLADPLIINIDNTLIGGHFRLKILKDKGIKEVDVRIPNRKLTDDEVRELNIRLNKNTGSFDFDMLANFDETLLKDIGFESVELDHIFQLDNNPDEDEAPEVPKKPKSKTGDIYQLGNHRVCCGDSTKKEDVDKLIDGKKADMVFTDPPYGLNIVKVGGGGKTKFGKVGGGKWVPANYYKPIINDDKEFNPDFLLEMGGGIMLFGGNYYSNKLPNSGCWLCWDKTGENNIKNNFADCEFVWTNFNKPSRVYRYLWRGLLKTGGEDLRKRVHPTQKPIALLINIIKDFTKENKIILDPFLGSGSTLIACEKTNRICYGMEIDSQYIDVIVQRYVNYTGNENIILNGKKIKWLKTEAKR